LNRHRLTMLKAMTLAALITSILWAILPSFSVDQPGSSPLRIGLPMISNFHLGWNALLGAYTVAFARYALVAGMVVAWRRSHGKVPREWMILAAVAGTVVLMVAVAWWNNRAFDTCHLFLAGLAAVLAQRLDAAFFDAPPRHVSGWVRMWCRSVRGTSPRERRAPS